MKDFQELVKEDRIEKVNVDKAKAKGLLKRSKSRFENQKRRKINENTAFEILENTYESIRETLEAGMAAEGYKSNDHVSTIAYAQEKLNLEKTTINKLHRFRKLRNESRYEAKEIRIEEAEQIIEFTESLMPKVTQKVEDKL